jgi:gamma-glutamyltranspeptidase / glutathione hydrolase
MPEILKSLHAFAGPKRLRVIVLLCAGLIGSPAFAADHGYVATVNPTATRAGLDALKAGGNAVDGAIAAALTLGVVDGYNSGLGGGCFLLIRLADGRVFAIDGRETAPAAATRDMFLRDGKAATDLSQTGPLAIGIPGQLAALSYASTNFGRLPIRQLLEKAADIADLGFILDRSYARHLADAAEDLRRFPASRAILLNPDGTVPKEGDQLRLTDLALSLRAVGEQGADWFYTGAFAHLTDTWMKGHGGLLTTNDFAAYRPIVREPIRTTYRGYEIIGFPPPSSGGVHVGQILNILEHFDLKAMGDDSADFVHVVTEAMKLAFADRAFWLGDPDFTPVPRGLVSQDYGAELAKRISMTRARPVPTRGEPPNSTSDVFKKHTTHFSTADAEGNWVACTSTINTSFGSKVVVPGTGIVFNNEMDDFSAQPGVANYFGLVGAEANSVAPGKRPLSSMSPTIVLKDGKPILAVGGAGGPTIISQTLLTIIRTIDFGMDPKAALAAPRFHHQWRPDELRVEDSLPAAVVVELEKRGHKLARVGTIGVSQAVGITATGGFDGASDPRVNGLAEGF